MNDLERKEALERELARREAKKSTSERQADYVTGRGRAADIVDLRVTVQRERDLAAGDDDERPELDGDATSRRQAARITRGRSS